MGFNSQLGSWFVGGAWNRLFFLLSLLKATKDPNTNNGIAIELIILDTSFIHTYRNKFVLNSNEKRNYLTKY